MADIKTIMKIAKAKRLRRQFWTKAEGFDGIVRAGCEAEFMFVVFSDDNPFVPMIDRAYKVMIAIRGGYRYVG